MRRNRWVRPVLALVAVVALVRLTLYGPGAWATARDWVRCNSADGAWQAAEQGSHCGNPQWCATAGGLLTLEGDRYVCVQREVRGRACSSDSDCGARQECLQWPNPAAPGSRFCGAPCADDWQCPDRMSCSSAPHGPHSAKRPSTGLCAPWLDAGPEAGTPSR